MNYSGITANPYSYLLGMAKGDLKQLIWGGLLFDPHSHNPQSPMPVGQIMRINMNMPDRNIVARGTIFIQGWGWDLLFNPIFIEFDYLAGDGFIDGEYAVGDIYDWLIKYYGGQNIPYIDNSTVHLTFSDNTYKSGVLNINYNGGDPDCPLPEYHSQWEVTFGEDPDLDVIIDEGGPMSISKASENENWPIPSESFVTTSNMGNLAFYEYINDVVIGNLRSNVPIVGLEEVESITLEDDTVVYPDYHGDDGDSYFVKCAVARNWSTNGVLNDAIDEQTQYNIGMDFSNIKGYRNSNYIESLSQFDGVDPRPYAYLVLELYPNVEYIQNSPVWMVVRKVFISIQGDVINGLKYRLVTTENNKSNMPFIYGGPWTKNGPINQDYQLDDNGQTIHDFSGDDLPWMVQSEYASNGRGLAGVWKWNIGQWIDMFFDENGCAEATIYGADYGRLDDYPWGGDPDYEDNMDYTCYVIVARGSNIVDENSTETWMTSDNELIGQNGLVNNFIVCGVDAETYSRWIDEGDFNGWKMEKEEELMHAMTLDDFFDYIIPQGWLCVHAQRDQNLHINYEGWLDADQFEE